MKKFPSTLGRLAAMAAIVSLASAQVAGAQGRRMFNKSAPNLQSGAKLNATKLQQSSGFAPRLGTPALGKASNAFKSGKLGPVIVSPGANSWKSANPNWNRKPNLTDAIGGGLSPDGNNFDRNRFFPGRIIPSADLTLPAQGGGNGAANPRGGAAGPNLSLPGLGNLEPRIPDLTPNGPIGNPNVPGGNGNPPANPGGRGRIPLPDLGQPRIPDLIPEGPIGDPVLPPGNGNPPADPENPPVDPADPGQPGDPGNPPGDPGNPPPADPGCPNLCPWPIFWPLYPGGGYCPTPVYPAQPVVVNDAVPVEAGQGGRVVDLVLEDVQYVEPATVLVGPAYRVKFRNQSTEPAGAFRVALLAGLEFRVSEKSPKAIVDVPGLAGGQAAQLTIRLPRTAMSLASASSAHPAVFTHLFAAVDFDNAVIELDKTNNVAILERSALESAARQE
jgi:hypothetical protein